MNPAPWQKLIGYNALQSLCVWSTIVSVRSLHKYDSMCCMHDTERVTFHVYREMHFPARATRGTRKILRDNVRIAKLACNQD